MVALVSLDVAITENLQNDRIQSLVPKRKNGEMEDCGQRRNQREDICRFISEMEKLGEAWRRGKSLL